MRVEKAAGAAPHLGADPGRNGEPGLRGRDRPRARRRGRWRPTATCWRWRGPPPASAPPTTPASAGTKAATSRASPTGTSRCEEFARGAALAPAGRGPRARVRSEHASAAWNSIAHATRSIRVRYRRHDTGELRQAFLVEDLFAPDEVRLLHWEAERTIIGSVVADDAPAPLPNPPEIKAAFFAERREIGIVNLGGAGTRHGGRRQPRARPSRHALRRARGAGGRVRQRPGRRRRRVFYLVSHPAHAAHPTTTRARVGAQTIPIGDTAHASAARAAAPHPREGRRAAASW